MKMQSFLLNITSEDPARMAAFYGDVMNLTPNPVIGEGAFDLLPGLTLHIDGHSSTHGMAKEPQRMMLDFFVDDLASEQARLKSKGVQFIGVSMDEPARGGDEKAVKKFLVEHEVPWPQYYLQGKPAFSDSYGVTRLPTLFIVDKQGVLRCVDGARVLDRLLGELTAL